MTPGALPSVPIDYPALIIPLLCAGVLFAGTFFFLYIYKRGKNPLYLSMGVLALSAFVFVFSEGMILYFGGIIHHAALGRQFHRIEQSAGALFIFTIPYFIGHFLRL